MAKPQANRAYKPYIATQKRYAVLMGGAGSGKSYAAADKYIIRMATVPGHKFAVGRKVLRTVRHSVFATLRARIHDLGLGDAFDLYRGELSIRRRDGLGEFISFGLDDPEKIKSIHGVTSMWLEEATEFTEEDFTQLDLRMRDPSPDGYSQITSTFNPISASHWLKRRFFDADNENVYRQITTFRDNAFLPDEYRATLVALQHQNVNLYRIYALGEWGILEGQIYPPWVMAYEEPTAIDETFYGIDFGYQNPTALVRVQMHDGDPYASEVFYETGLTNADVIERCKAVNLIERSRIYADAAEPQRIEEMRRAGLNVYPADKGPGSVQAGIGFVQGLRVHTRPENVNLNREHGSYVWREDKDGNPTDEPVKFNDHALDALRYALFTHLRHGAGKPSDVRFSGAQRSVQRESLRSVANQIAEEYFA